MAAFSYLGEIFMRVMFLVYGLRHGGAERVLLELAVGFKKLEG